MREEDTLRAGEDFFDRVSSQRHEIVSEWLRAQGRLKRISWPRVPAERLSRIWLVYGRRGTIFDEEGLDKIADQVLTLIARLQASTELCGHVSYDVKPDVEDDFARKFTDKEWDDLLSTLEDERGNYLCSDYAFRWLMPLYGRLFLAPTAEDKLLLVDRVLNVVHQRSDLAACFVEGGRATLRRIAEQGGYETPDAALDQVAAMHCRVTPARQLNRLLT